MHDLAAVAGTQSEREYFILSDNPKCSHLNAYNLTLMNQDLYEDQLHINTSILQVNPKRGLGAW